MEQELEFMRRNHPDILEKEPPYVAVQFSPNLRLAYSDDGIKQLTDRQFAPIQRLTARFPGLRMTRLYQGLAPDKLSELVKRAQAADETYRPGPFFSYFKIEYDDADQLPAIAKEMQGWREVEQATVFVPAPSPMVNAANDVRAVNQTYLNVAPGGIDARYAWTFPGGDGQGQRLVDIERGWTFNHEDLLAHGITFWIPTASTAPRCWAKYARSITPLAALASRLTSPVCGGPLSRAVRSRTLFWSHWRICFLAMSFCWKRRTGSLKFR